MYARTTTVRGDPRAVDDGIALARGEIWPRLERMDGCVGMSMLADRRAGRCIVTAAWATEDAMRASADDVRDLRRQLDEVLRAGAVEIDEGGTAVLSAPDRRGRRRASGPSGATSGPAGSTGWSTPSG